jgi:hypothetical protein
MLIQIWVRSSYATIAQDITQLYRVGIKLVVLTMQSSDEVSKLIDFFLRQMRLRF